jgi:glucose/arabinose dehydrogenase
VTWSTDVASPSGLAVTDDAVYVAALRGARLWEVPWADGGVAGEPVAHLVGDLGRLRHVAVGPDGALWVLTNNTDGRGEPREGDDRLVRLLPP